MFILRTPDANTDSTSSNESHAQNGEESQTSEQDAIDAAVSKLAKSEGDESQQQEQQEEQPQQQEGAESSTETQEEQTSQDQQSNEQEQQEQEQEQQHSQAVIDKAGDEKLPFNQHPRFQELVTEKNGYKAEVETLKPLAERTMILDNYVQQHGISQQQLTNALEYTRLVNSDPIKARELLRPVWENLSRLTGDLLPPELEAEVTAGIITPQRARELAMHQAQQSYQQWRQQNGAQNDQQRMEQMIQGSIDAWAQAKMQTDADLRPKQPGQADGKWEVLDMKLRSIRQQNPPRNTQEALAQVEQAYKETTAFFSRFVQPKRLQKPPLRSSQNNSNTSGVLPRDVNAATKDIVAAVMSGKKPSQMRYATK